MMDPTLKEAVKNGDVKYLIESVSQQSSDYFLTHSPREKDSSIAGNIFHLAAWYDKDEFFREAMERLSKQLRNVLLFQKDEDGWTPLHAAAIEGAKSDVIVKIIMDYYYESLSIDDDGDGDGDGDGVGKYGKPWLELTPDKRTPLHMALKESKENEKCAMQILLMDVELLSSMVDEEGNTPLFLALRNGFTQVAYTILMSCPISSISVTNKDGSTPFHFASNCSENVFRQLLEKCGDCIDKIDNRGYSALHQWAEIGEAWLCKLLLESSEFPEAKSKIFKDLVCFQEEKQGDTPLHIAGRKKDSELAEILVRGYQQQVSVVEGEVQESLSVQSPWKIKNKSGNTPLHTALYTSSKHEKLAMEILSIDPTLCQIHNNKGESPFFLAVRSGIDRIVEKILRIEEPRFDMVRRNDGMTVLHSLPFCPEKTARKLLEKYWWMINLADDNKKTALDKAKEANTLWLVSLLTNPSLIQKEKFDWIAACEKEETQAVVAFIDNCQDLQRACREENDTPLHHIKLPTYKDYLNFLKIPSIGELKNTTDHDGATPLHRALERKDMLLAKILLLDNGVERIIADHNGNTAMDLLATLCKQNDDWEKMCKQIKVNPYLRTTYIQPGTNLEQIRNTLSVVAALLATITFAAGFTLPGGINSSTGQAILAKKAAFLVFLLADVYAMCTSMLVLFCLIWSMVSELDMARLLVDRSVFILMQSLYGTLLAFMTGIYTVIANSSLWAAILIFVMCSIIGISANRTILHNVIAKLVPAANTQKLDRVRLLEEGNAGASSAGNDTSRKME